MPLIQEIHLDVELIKVHNLCSGTDVAVMQVFAAAAEVMYKSIT